MAKTSRLLMTGLIAIVIGMSALSFMPARSSAAVYWTAHAGPSGPNEIYIDQYPTFTFYIHNDGSVGLDIWNFYVTFDWDPSTQYTLVGSTHVTVAAGTDSAHYTRQVHIPLTATAGSHDASIHCTGQASGDWLSTPGSWTFPFTVDTVPTLVVPSTGANPNSGTAPLTVNFDPSPSGGLLPYTYSWTFGDGGTSTNAAPSHIYLTAGTFTATVIVTDTETSSQIKTASSVITVTWPSFAVTGTASLTSGRSPLSVDFTCTPSGGNGVYSYSWDFGDQSSISTAKNPTHEFSSSGTYTVTVTVTDTASNTVHWSQVITVTKPSTTLTSPMVIVGIIAVIAGIGVIVVVVFLGRKKKTGGKGSTPPVQGSGSP